MFDRQMQGLMLAAVWAALPAVVAGCGKGDKKAEQNVSVAQLEPRAAPEGQIVVSAETIPVPPVPVTFAAAESVFHAGRYDEAVELFKGYTAEKPDNIWGHYMLGLSAWKAGDFAMAENEFTRVLEVDPDHVKSRQNLARVYLETGYPEKALEQAEVALGLDSTSVDGFRILGRAHDEAGNLEGAVEAYKQALTIDAKDAWSMNNLGLVLIQQDKIEEAIAPLALATQVRPEVPVFHNNLGMALELTGYSKDATTAYQKAVDLDGAYQKAVTNLARTSQRADEPDLPSLDLAVLAEQFAKHIEGWKTLAVN